MPKAMKTHRSLAKKVKVTARGKIVYKKPGLNHLMSGKSGQRKMKLRRTGQVTNGLAQRMLIMMGKD
jgi:large subunit ribosomal protein L35